MLSIGTILTPQVHIINGLPPPPQHAAVHLHQPRHPEAAPGGCAALRRAALFRGDGKLRTAPVCLQRFRLPT